MSDRKRILVVDDDVSYLQSLKSVLARQFEVRIASSFEEGKKMLSDEVDALVLDIRLADDPDNRDGLALLQWVKSNYADVPVVMMSSYRDLEQEGRRLGADQFLTKPLNLTELKAVLASLAWKKGP